MVVAEIDELRAGREADAKVIAALREALEPFAKMGTVWLFDQMTPDDYAVAGNAGGVVTAGTFKKAARIYERSTQESET